MKQILLKCRILIVAASVFYSCNIYSQKNISLIGHLSYPDSITCSNVTSYTDSLGNQYALVGTSSGLSIVNIDSSDKPVQLYMISTDTGALTSWNEARIYKDYAYVISTKTTGLLVVNLKYLPDSIQYALDTPRGMRTAQSIFIDEKGIAYINGTDSGQLFLSLDSNLSNPPVAGKFTASYVQDCFVRNNTMYAACPYDGIIKVVNVANKTTADSAINLLASWSTPSGYPFSCWLSDDNNYLFTTDEVLGSYLACYNVSDLNTVYETGQSPLVFDSNFTVHNTRFINNYCVTSGERYGLAIFDALRKNNLIRIGNFNTSVIDSVTDSTAIIVPGNVQDVWPYLTSGNILAADNETGLWILGPTYVRPAYLEGVVMDSLCNIAEGDVEISILGDSTISVSNSLGLYGIGTTDTGTYTIEFSKPGYQTLDTGGIDLQNGMLMFLDINMAPLTTSQLTVQTLDSATNDSLPFQPVLIQDTLGNTYQQVATNYHGQYSICDFLQGTYNFYSGFWGRNTAMVTAVDSTQIDTVAVATTPGYYDDFIMDYGWTTSSTSTSGAWVRTAPIGVYLNGDTVHPAYDVPGDFGSECYVTGNDSIGPEASGVQNGYTVLVSPLFNLDSYSSPYISYYLWYYETGDSTATNNDSLVVLLSNGFDTVVIDVADTSRSEWQYRKVKVAKYTVKTANMSLLFMAQNTHPGRNLYAGVDEFKVFNQIDSTPDTAHTDTTGITIINRDGPRMKAHPNPFDDEVYISISELNSKDAELELTNNLGQKVYSSKVTNMDQVIRLNETIPAGIYYLRLLVDKIAVQSVPLIKTE